MDKSNLDLFKQAINEGLSNKFDNISNCYTEEIVCSKQHNIAMRTIVYGKTDNKRAWSPKMKRIVAILVAAALLLTSCGIIFRNEIRDVIEDISEFFTKLTYSNDGAKGEVIEEVYELTYVPEGYYLEDSYISTVVVKYDYQTLSGEEIDFEQWVIDGSSFHIDRENGYTEIIKVNDYSIYYKKTKEYNNYLWNDGKYTFKLVSSNELSLENINLIVIGISTKS